MFKKIIISFITCLLVLTQVFTSSSSMLYALESSSEGYTITFTPAITRTSTNGDYTVLDKIYGTSTLTNDWLGIEGQDVEFVVDFKEEKSFANFTLGFLKSWQLGVRVPESVTIQGSLDGTDYFDLAVMGTTNAFVNASNEVERLSAQVDQMNARYIKVSVKNAGPLPTGHNYAGSKSWIFMDEFEWTFAQATKADLSDLLNTTRPLDPNNYSKQSGTAFKYAREEAEAVYVNDQASDAEIYNAYIQLKDAYNQLVIGKTVTSISIGASRNHSLTLLTDGVFGNGTSHEELAYIGWEGKDNVEIIIELSDLRFIESLGYSGLSCPGSGIYNPNATFYLSMDGTNWSEQVGHIPGKLTSGANKNVYAKEASFVELEEAYAAKYIKVVLARNNTNIIGAAFSWYFLDEILVNYHEPIKNVSYPTPSRNDTASWMTLVDGLYGNGTSHEELAYIGWEGKDNIEVIIPFDELHYIKSLGYSGLTRANSGIYNPDVQFYVSMDGENWGEQVAELVASAPLGVSSYVKEQASIELDQAIPANYLKAVFSRNQSHKVNVNHTWIFLDEIEYTITHPFESVEMNVQPNANASAAWDCLVDGSYGVGGAHGESAYIGWSKQDNVEVVLTLKEAIGINKVGYSGISRIKSGIYNPNATYYVSMDKNEWHEVGTIQGQAPSGTTPYAYAKEKVTLDLSQPTIAKYIKVVFSRNHDFVPSDGPVSEWYFIDELEFGYEQVETSNKTNLQSLFDEVSTLLSNSENYTVTSAANAQNVLLQSKEVLDDAYATSDEIEAAITELENAKAGLVDVTSLKQVIAEAEAMDQDFYSATSYQALMNVVAQAKNLFQDGSKEAVQQAITDIEQAKAALVVENKTINVVVVTSDEDNDLYQTMMNTYKGVILKADLDEALSYVEAHAEVNGIMVLADQYPDQTTIITEEQSNKIESLGIRLYVEYPENNETLGISGYNGTNVMAYNRAIVTNATKMDMPQHSLLYVHGAKFVSKSLTPTSINEDAYWLVSSKVAGYDIAEYGISEATYSLIEVNENVMIASTKFSQFIAARYAPYERYQKFWSSVFAWLTQNKVAKMEWEPLVQPTYEADEEISKDAYKDAIEANIEWFKNSGFILSEEDAKAYMGNASDSACENGEATDVPVNRELTLGGDGSYGILEAFVSGAAFNEMGEQKLRFWRRADCNGESAGNIALAGSVLGNDEYLEIAYNVVDWLLTESFMSQGDRANPEKADYGLLTWHDGGSGIQFETYYGDDNAKAVLGLISALSALRNQPSLYTQLGFESEEAYLSALDQLDKRVLEVILGNYRTTSTTGMRSDALSGSQLDANGWEYYFNKEVYNYAPHFEALNWATYLWAYGQTGYKPLLERTKKGIKLMMAAYEKTMAENTGTTGEWYWTNGLQQERAKMILPLAWLVRVDAKEEHIQWLNTMIEDMMMYQDEETGALQDRVGEAGQGYGKFGAHPSNYEYGRHEGPVIQNNGDPCIDALYTASFAMLSLNEATAVMKAENRTDLANTYENYSQKLSDFFVRIQSNSTNKNYDGVWFRGFDYEKWEVYGSDGDAAWGVWCTETGWTQAWISNTLSMKVLETNVWDYTQNSSIENSFEDTAVLMLNYDPNELYETVEVTPLGRGSKDVLTNGIYGTTNHDDGQWIGTQGNDVTITIDYQTVKTFDAASLGFILNMGSGICPAKSVTYYVSNDGINYGEAIGSITITEDIQKEYDERTTAKVVRPVCEFGKEISAQYVKVVVESAGQYKKGSQTLKSWLFMDELELNLTKANKYDLYDLLKKVRPINASSYTLETKEPFEAARSEAEVVYANEMATAEEINEVYQNLKTTYASLKMDKVVLSMTASADGDSKDKLVDKQYAQTYYHSDEEYVGWQNVQTIEVIVDLLEPTGISEVGFSASSRPKWGIYVPNATVYVSLDNENWRSVAYLDAKPHVGEIVVPKGVKNTQEVTDIYGRYVKYVFENDSEHIKDGVNNEWIFIDEVMIERCEYQAPTVSVVEGTLAKKDVLVDGEYGITDMTGEKWRQVVAECNGADFAFVVDYGKEKTFDTISLGAFECLTSGIVAPSQVAISVSNDNVTFTPLTVIEADDNHPSSASYERLMASVESTTARYVKVNVTNYGQVVGGNGKLSNSWVMLDEFETYQTVQIAPFKNIAKGKAAYADSIEANSVRAELAVDGNTSSRTSRWGSARGLGAHWIYVDLGEISDIGSVKVFWEQRKPTAYSIQVSNDAQEWETVQSFNEHPPTLTERFVFDEIKKARYVRLYIDSFTEEDPDGGVKYNTVSIYELEVYSGIVPPTLEEYLADITIDESSVNESKLSFNLPEVSEGIQITYNGSDYEQIIDDDLTIYQPIVDKTVLVSFKIENAETGEYKFREIPVLVPGKYQVEESDNEAPLVLPELTEWKGHSGFFKANETSKIVIANESLSDVAKAFATDYKDLFDCELDIVIGSEADVEAGDFFFDITTDLSKGLKTEGNMITISDYIYVEAQEVIGAYWATRTILQALKSSGNQSIPKGITRDYPLYEVRGIILDVGRKAFSLSQLQQIVKQMAWYKLNDFQVHLNDNYIWLEQYTNNGMDPLTAYSGFRLESNIKAGDSVELGNENKTYTYQQDLTSKDVFYTKAEFKQFIKDAKAIGVNVVPEIDTPAHSLALTKVLPELRFSTSGKGNDHLDLVNQYDECFDFVTNIFDEYLEGDDPVFGQDTIVHVGCDEYEQSPNNFRQFSNDLTQYIEDSGRTARIWGGFTKLVGDGSVAIDGEGIQLNLWDEGYANMHHMYELGFDLINCDDDDYYIVPNAGYYKDYLNANTMYNLAVNNIGGLTIPAGDAQMLGGAFAIWNDMIGLRDNGISEYDIYVRANQHLGLFAAKLWGKQSLTLDQAQSAASILADAPNTNFEYDLDDVQADDYEIKELHNVEVDIENRQTIVELKGASSYVTTGIETAGLNNSLKVKVKRTSESTDEQILFESPYGAIKAVQAGTGKVGISREIFDYSFNYTLPVNEWVELEFRNRFEQIDLYVNGTKVDTLGDGDKAGNNNRPLKATCMFPLAKIGSETKAFVGSVASVQLNDIELLDYEADYRAVDVAIAQAEAIHKEEYANYELVQTAIDAVIYGYRKDQQAVVDAMAQAIVDAMDALIKLPQQVSNVQADVVDYKTIQLSWDAQADVTYIIERLSGEEWIEVGQTSESTYTVTGIKTGKEYTCRITATKVIENENVYAISSEVASATPMLSGEVELSIAPNGTTKFDLTWTAVAGATRYIVYRKSSDSEWKKILTLGKDARSYTSKDMKLDTYQYMVKAARYDSVERVMTNGSNVVEGIVRVTEMRPTNAKAEVVDGSVVLTWDKVAGMTHYEIYRSKDDGAYRHVKTTNANTLTNTTLKAGSTYRYKIRAYAVVNGEKVYAPDAETTPITIE